LSKETYHLIGNRELSLCKDGVIIVNTARGKVIDEPALVKALESGKVASVGLDVFEEVRISGTIIPVIHAAY
jgi:lactate dehydrogenase-like 2-hydroxyacid dehydrogenase